MPFATRLPMFLLALPVLLLPAACMSADPRLAACPQPRATLVAPDEFLALRNPLADTAYDRERARHIFETNDGAGCIACHGKKGDGRGRLASRLDPPPRNFACRATMAAVPDGQLFWVIRHGSPGTAMLGHGELSDEETWQVVRYIRELAR